MDLYELVNETRELSVDKLVEDIKGMGFQSKEELEQYLEENDSFNDYVWESASIVMDRRRYSELFNCYVENSDDIDDSYTTYIKHYGVEVIRNSIEDSIQAGILYYLYSQVYNNKEDVFFELVNEYFNYE